MSKQTIRYEGGVIGRTGGRWYATHYPSKTRLFETRSQAEAWLSSRVATFGASSEPQKVSRSETQPYTGIAFFN